MKRRTPLHIEALDERVLPSFSPAVSYDIGASPQAMVTGDFNGDGKIDLATANPESGTVSVLLGDGQGRFLAAIDSNSDAITGANRASLAVADFNKDGKLDLAVVNHYQDADGYNYGSLRLLLGNGNGAFQPPASIITVNYPLSVAAGDINKDGNLDIVVSGDDGDSFGSIDVLLGNGQGYFDYPLSHWIYGPSIALSIVDIDGEGNLDAITSDPHVLLGHGDGTLTENAFWNLNGSDPNAWAMAIGDFTGDSIPDLAVAGLGVAVRRGRGDGWFDAATHHLASGEVQTGVATGDFNGDSKLDVVTSDRITGTVSELLGNGDGTLTYTGAFATGASPEAVVVGDFNGDGRPDVASANSASNTVSVLLNDGTWSPPPPPLAAISIADAIAVEGNTGTAGAAFTVTLSAASTETVTVAYATGNGTAAANNDYLPTSGTLTFAPGETSKTITVLVNGDRIGEADETFVVNLGGATNATIADGQAVGTILDDEPRISISDVTKAEGKKGQTILFTFTVTLSVAYDQAITMSYRTVNGTATTSDGDYNAKTGTLTFAPGETAKTITIEVKGDIKKEANETFYLDLFGLSSNGMFTKNRGVGTILNDD